MTGPSATADPDDRSGRSDRPVLVLDGRPRSALGWLGDVVAAGPVLVALARKDFTARYKAASLGVVWSVAVPLLQAAVLAFVFSRAIRGRLGVDDYGAFVLAGMLPWSYFSATLLPATTAIVDGASMADKVWFPRILLTLAPVGANLVGLVVTHLALLVALPVLGVGLRLSLLALPLAMVLLVAFTASLSAVLSASQVYFRDTKFVVQAALLVWIYLTPIIYPADLLGRWAGWLDLNPMTGVVALTRAAALGTPDWQRPVAVSVAWTILAAVVAIELHRRHDRRFVDLL